MGMVFGRHEKKAFSISRNNHHIVNEQKPVMRLVELLYLDKWTLGVVAVNIQPELAADTLRVNSGRYLFLFLILC